MNRQVGIFNKWFVLCDAFKYEHEYVLMYASLVFNSVNTADMMFTLYGFTDDLPDIVNLQCTLPSQFACARWCSTLVPHVYIPLDIVKHSLSGESLSKECPVYLCLSTIVGPSSLGGPRRD